MSEPAPNVCDGYYYYRLVGASDIGEDPTANTIPLTAFFTATLHGGPLENCVLAPVTSEHDLNEIAVAAGQERYTYVGVRKSTSALFVEAAGGSTDNWYNLDGTPVPTSAWNVPQPNNGGGLQAYAMFDTSGTGGLNDIDNYRLSITVNKAVMKCCAEGYAPKTFCTKKKTM